MVFGNDYDTKDGTCMRDYIHVLDLCSAHILAFEKLCEGMNSEVFNLGYGHGYSVMEIIKTAEEVVGKNIKYEIAPRRAGDPANLVASSDKIREKLGWKPKYDNIKTIIESAYNFHKNNI